MATLEIRKETQRTIYWWHCENEQDMLATIEKGEAIVQDGTLEYGRTKDGEWAVVVVDYQPYEEPVNM